MNDRPLSVHLTLGLILVNALIWLALGVIIAADVHPALPDEPLAKGLRGFLSFAAAGVLLVLWFYLMKRSRIAYFLAIAALGLAAVLVVFDDVGWTDLVVFIVSIAPVVLLIKDHDWYLQTKPESVGGV